MRDLLAELRRAIDARLAELRPLVEELRQLEHALGRLNAIGASGRRAAPTRASRRPRTTRASVRPRAATRRRAPRGQNVAAILAAVKERPGIKPAEVAAATGIAKGTASATISKLKRDGRLRADRGGGLRVVSAARAGATSS